ncbi:carbon-nitrogen hydrolase [Dothidotthia symphoricarpi CBS 119687]|uniref:Carbon-nitrogen hydrolase n=1 Tax=Dothidotthia symphoricarpi CBS 119687 TaxID=1392245 RepID=A0A6A6ABS0_9PLEO|nr:carbon-nitrogen hydrolase [Dothidotthia symphoricarpi CBS 119687]KAF2128464.1 carbon-nitrogen hydrolase [Dothidotthia symphoricarpi CBS 119687]
MASNRGSVSISSPSAEERKMKIACLQFAPEVGKVQENMSRADSILRDTQLPSDLDWLVLPEMAFSGYNFYSLEEIRPYLEPTTSGISTQWAIRVAAYYNCHVTIGYPELTTTQPPTQYNSTVTVSPQGKILSNYRKSFLYYTDETWASEGPGSFSHHHSDPDSPDSPFYSGPLGALGNVTLGICMDINPYKFTAPWESYEFANTALTNSTPLICVSMAWLCHLTPEELMRDPTQPDVATVAYWVERFQPIVEAMGERPVYVVLANRSGMEKGVCYAGSSTIAKIEKGNVSLFETAGKSEEKCLVVDLADRPKFQVRSGTR